MKELQRFRQAPPETPHQLDRYSSQELKKFIEDMAQERGLDPQMVDSFLNEKKEDTSNEKKDLRALYIMIAAYLVSGILYANSPEFRDALGAELPNMIHNALNVFHRLTNNQADSAALAEHLQYVFLDLSLAAGGVALKDYLFSSRLRQSQKQLRKDHENGTIRYDMPEGHTAAFADFSDGGKLVDMLDRTLPTEELMVYGTEHTGIATWQKLVNLGEQKKVYEMFERGSLSSAGEIVIFAIDEQHFFLQHPTENHTMTLNEIITLIELVDGYCEDKNLPPKPIYIIADKQGEAVQMHWDTTNGIHKEVETVQQRIDKLNRQRAKREYTTSDGAVHTLEQIDILDPTEIIFDRLYQKVIQMSPDGTVRPIIFSTSESGLDFYQKEFENLLESVGYNDVVDPSLPYIHIRYDISDDATTGADADVSPSDEIVIVLRSSYKERIARRGVPRQQIIVGEEILSNRIQRVL